MLTTALNKSPKPPIIVDDIIVTELNLGSTPPELEILEIGDLADDRFRGIFKMSYTGDAFLTLKTRVQANPLNTYLSTKPSFASPQPLAASSGLTIPLQITLSDIRLSGFVILVFSRQKGITLVFRNDPLESLKVSSTFDSIPFVRDYLQKEIEGQLRVLFMEDLPAIIHRLSLQLWGPENESIEPCSGPLDESKNNERPINPLATPSQTAYDAFGHPLDEDVAELSLEESTETHASFSQKNLLRLAALTDSHRTLSLFTPPIRDAVFRAWAGAAEKSDGSTTMPTAPSFTLASLSSRQARAVSIASSANSTSDSVASTVYSSSSRPSLVSHASTYSNMGAATKARSSRKRNNRVVDLRRPATVERTVAEYENAMSDSRSYTPVSTTIFSQATIASGNEADQDELVTPPDSPEQRKGQLHHVRIQDGPPEILSPRPRSARQASPALIHNLHLSQPRAESASPTPQSHSSLRRPDLSRVMFDQPPQPPSHSHHQPKRSVGSYRSEKVDFASFAQQSSSGSSSSSSNGGILEQAWMMKMATEIARKVASEKEREAAMSRGDPNHSATVHGGFWDSSPPSEQMPPPAYAA